MLFQGPSTQSVPTPPLEAASPASQSVPLPCQTGQAQPYQPPFAQPAMSQLQSLPPQSPKSHQSPPPETPEREYSPGSDIPPSTFPSNSDPAEPVRGLELGDSFTVAAYFFGVDADEPRIVQVTCTLEDPEEIGYLCHRPKFEEYVQWDKLGFVVVQRATRSSTAPLLPHSLSLFFDDNGLINGQWPNRCVEKLVGGPGKSCHHWVGDFMLFRDKGRDRFCDITEEDLAPIISFFRDYRRIVFW